MRLSSRLINNAIINLSGSLWPIVLGLITTPYIVNSLGVEPYGILVLVPVTLGYMVFLDLGLNVSLVKYVAQYRAVEDLEAIKVYVGTSLIIYTFVGAAGSILLCGLAYPLVSFFKITPDLQPVAQFAFYVAAAGFFTNLMISVFQAIIVGYQRYDLSNLINVSHVTAQTIGTVLILWQGLGLKEVVLFQLLTTLIKLGWSFYVSSRLIPGSAFRLTFDLSASKRLVQFGFMSLISRLSGLLSFQFDRTYIGFALGAASVTYYTIPSSVARQLHTFPAYVTRASFPLASELASTQQVETLRQLYLRGLKWSVALAVAMTSVLGALSFKLLYYWMGPEFAEVSTNVLRVLLLTYCVYAFTPMPYHIVDGSGLPRYNALFASINAISSVIGCFILVPKWGILGAAAANALSILVTPIYLSFVERKVLNIKTASHVFNVYIRSLAAASLTFLFVYLIQLYWVNSLIAVVITAGAGMAIFALFALIFGVLEPEDKDVLFEYLKWLGAQAKSRPIVQRFSHFMRNRYWSP